MKTALRLFMFMLLAAAAGCLPVIDPNGRLLPPLASNAGVDFAGGPGNIAAPRPGSVENGGLWENIDYFRMLNSHSNTPLLHLSTNDKLLALLQYGADRQIHFVQSFFLGYLPEGVHDIGEARRFVAQHVVYETDEQGFGRDDVWQTSRETRARGRGDCEDHAVLLADILIRLGYDARVAIGQKEGGGHAWVLVAGRYGELLLVEATDKDERLEPPSALDWRVKYVPDYLVNDKYVWELEKGRSGMHASDWKLSSSFHERWENRAPR